MDSILVEVYCRHCQARLPVSRTGDGKLVIGLHRCPREPGLLGGLLDKAEKKLAAQEEELIKLRELKLHRHRGDGANYKVPINSEHDTLLYYLVRCGATSDKRAIPMRELVRIVNRGGDYKRNGRPWEPGGATSGRLSELRPYDYVRMVDRRVLFADDGEGERFIYDDRGDNVKKKYRNKPLWYATPEGCGYIHKKYDAGKDGREREMAAAAMPDEQRDVA